MDSKLGGKASQAATMSQQLKSAVNSPLSGVGKRFEPSRLVQIEPTSSVRKAAVPSSAPQAIKAIGKDTVPKVMPIPKPKVNKCDPKPIETPTTVTRASTTTKKPVHLVTPLQKAPTPSSARPYSSFAFSRLRSEPDWTFRATNGPKWRKRHQQVSPSRSMATAASSIPQDFTSASAIPPYSVNHPVFTIAAKTAPRWSATNADISFSRAFEDTIKTSHDIGRIYGIMVVEPVYDWQNPLQRAARWLSEVQLAHIQVSLQISGKGPLHTPHDWIVRYFKERLMLEEAAHCSEVLRMESITEEAICRMNAGCRHRKYSHATGGRYLPIVKNGPHQQYVWEQVGRQIGRLGFALDVKHAEIWETVSENRASHVWHFEPILRDFYGKDDWRAKVREVLGSKHGKTFDVKLARAYLIDTGSN